MHSTTAEYVGKGLSLVKSRARTSGYAHIRSFLMFICNVGLKLVARKIALEWNKQRKNSPVNSSTGTTLGGTLLNTSPPETSVNGSWTYCSVPTHVLMREGCACGRSFTICGPSEYPATLASEGVRWRAEHMCEKRAQLVARTPEEMTESLNYERAAEWQKKLVGTVCTVCNFRMDTARNITTLTSWPIHVGCRTCSICRQPKPYKMEWIAVGTLAHPKCYAMQFDKEGKDYVR